MYVPYIRVYIMHIHLLISIGSRKDVEGGMEYDEDI